MQHQPYLLHSPPHFQLKNPDARNTRRIQLPHRRIHLSHTHSTG